MQVATDLRIKLVVVWALIVPLLAFAGTLRSGSAPVSLSVVPQVPRADEPVVATFRLNNHAPVQSGVDYRFYAGGRLLASGRAELAPLSSKQYQYIYDLPVTAGERVTFTLRCRAGGREYIKMVSSPPFPPQTMSSFVSFAAFSSTMMSSVVTADYYDRSFGGRSKVNAGLIVALVLIALLVFLELAGPLLEERPMPRLGKLARNLNMLTWVLLVIFAGMVYTRIIMILAA